MSDLNDCSLTNCGTVAVSACSHLSGRAVTSGCGAFHSDFSFLLVLLIIDVEVAHLVRGLVRGNDAQEVSQLLGLQVLLAQILQVTLGERRLSSDMDLGLLPVDADLVSQVASLSIHLDALQQELLEILGLNDVVIRRLLAVQGELQGGLLGLFL